MKITIFLFIVGFCLISAKYLPYESSGSDVLLRSKRSDSDDSSTSVEQNKNENEEDNEDDSDDNNDSNDSIEKKLKEAELKRKEQEEKAQRKILEKQEKEKHKKEEEERKLEEKRAKEQRKEEEKTEREERKRLERTEKEKRKAEEKERKLLEKQEKEEKKKQEKQRKELEKLEKETLQKEENDFLETEEDSSVELDDIWKNHIYAKYGLTFGSTKLEKQAALNKYLKEELGLSSNSTESERYQAIVKLIQTKLQTDAAERDALRTQFLNHVNALSIQKLRAELEKDLEELNNKTEVLNNVILPWVPVAQQQIDEKISFLQTISQFLSSILPNWVNAEDKNTTQQNLNNNLNNPTGIVNTVTGDNSNVIPDNNVNNESIVTNPADNNLIGSESNATPSDTDAKDSTSQDTVISKTDSSVVENKLNTNENKPTDVGIVSAINSNNDNVGITTMNSAPGENNSFDGSSISAINEVNDSNSQGIIISQGSSSMAGNNSSVDTETEKDIEDPAEGSNVKLGASGTSTSDTVVSDIVSTNNEVPSKNISKSSGSGIAVTSTNSESIKNEDASAGALGNELSGTNGGSIVVTSENALSKDSAIPRIGNDDIVSGIQTINSPNPTPDSVLPITVDVLPVNSANVDTMNIANNNLAPESVDVAGNIPSGNDNGLDVTSEPIINNDSKVVAINDINNNTETSQDVLSENSNSVVPSADGVNNDNINIPSGILNASPVGPDSATADNINNMSTDVTEKVLLENADNALPASSDATTVDHSEAQQETDIASPTVSDASDPNVIKTSGVDIPSSITSQSVPETNNVPPIDGNLAANTDPNSNVNEIVTPANSVSSANSETQAAISSIPVPNNDIPSNSNVDLNAPVDIVSGTGEVPSGIHDSATIQESGTKINSSSSANIPSISITENNLAVNSSDAADSSNAFLNGNENSLSESSIASSAVAANLEPANEINNASNGNKDTVSENTIVSSDVSVNSLTDNTENKDIVTSSPIVVTGDTIAPDVIISIPVENTEMNTASTVNPLIDSDTVKEITTLSGIDNNENVMSTNNAEANMQSEPLVKETNESSPAHTVLPEEPSTSVQVGDGVTIPIEPGASVVEVVAQ